MEKESEEKTIEATVWAKWKWNITSFNNPDTYFIVKEYSETGNNHHQMKKSYYIHVANQHPGGHPRGQYNQSPTIDIRPFEEQSSVGE